MSMEMELQEEQQSQVLKKLRPLYDRILIRVQESPDTVVNGLVIPDVAQEKPLEGIVLAVGNGKVMNGERIPVDVKVGQTVVFGRYCGNEVKLNGEKLLLLQEQEIQAVYESYI